MLGVDGRVERCVLSENLLLGPFPPTSITVEVSILEARLFSRPVVSGGIVSKLCNIETVSAVSRSHRLRGIESLSAVTAERSRG